MFRKIALFTLLLAFCVIVLGAYVRLSDAGLGCPDWPGCYGRAMVSDAADFRKQAEQAFPDQLLDTAKAWKEMSHRYLAGALGALILLLAALAWREKYCRKAAVVSTLALLLLVVFQAALGMWTVTMRVLPSIVTSHLLIGLLTFWLLFWICLRVRPEVRPRSTVNGPRTLALFTMLLLLLQILLGGWTSSNYAALVCPDFPQCQAQWWPRADYRQGFNFLNGLLGNDYVPLSFQAKIAIHWLHRVGALVVFILLGVLAITAASVKYPRPVRKAGMLLSLLLFLQIGLGILNVKLGLPLWSAVAHNGVAALLM